jgi:hypothetical protein
MLNNCKDKGKKNNLSRAVKTDRHSGCFNAWMSLILRMISYHPVILIFFKRVNIDDDFVKNHQYPESD